MGNNKRKSNSKKQKQVKSSDPFPAPRKKAVRFTEDPGNTNKRQPVWVFSVLDENGPWGKVKLSGDSVWNDILPKIRSYESMTWGQIEQNKKYNHSVGIDALCPTARKRIDHLKLDVDELFRFRLSGKQRLWGIRDRERFKILWWDPDHEICPSTMKRT